MKLGDSTRTLVALAACFDASWSLVLDPLPHTAWGPVSSDGLSRRADVRVPFTNSSGADDEVFHWRVDLVGNAAQRGQAQGELFADEIVELYRVAMPKYFAQAGLLNTSGLPPALAKAIHAGLAETAFYRAMQWVWNREAFAVPPRLVAEMEAIAEGLCESRARRGLPCDVGEWTQNVQRLNMFPELIKMTCTMFGVLK